MCINPLGIINRNFFVLILMFCFVISCKNVDEKTLVETLKEVNHVLKKKYNTDLKLDGVVIENGFDLRFNNFSSRVFKYYPDFSRKVKDSVLNSLNWTQKDYHKIEKNVVNIAKNLFSLSKTDSINQVIVISQRHDNLFFIEVLHLADYISVNKLKNFGYDDLIKGDLSEIANYTSLVILLKKKSVNNVYVESGGVGHTNH